MSVCLYLFYCRRCKWNSSKPWSGQRHGLPLQTGRHSNSIPLTGTCTSATIIWASSCSLLTISLLPQWETLRGLTANDRHLYSLWTVLSLAAHQAPGLPLTNHALFLRHRIDSLTVRGVANPITTHDHRSLNKLARQDTVKLDHFLALLSHRCQPHIRLISPYHMWQLLLSHTES